MNETLRAKAELIYRMNQHIRELNSLQAQFNALSTPQYQYVEKFSSPLDLMMRLDRSDFDLICELLDACDIEAEHTTPAPAPGVPA